MLIRTDCVVSNCAHATLSVFITQYISTNEVVFVMVVFLQRAYRQETMQHINISLLLIC